MRNRRLDSVGRCDRVRLVDRGAGIAEGAAGAGEDRISHRIERLSDLAWELRDNEVRYRDLLDSQNDIISRSDPAGRLTFVNRAFCRTFGLSPGNLLGTVFQPTVLQGQMPYAGGPATRIGRFEVELATTVGPRWYSFEQQAILADNGSVRELQAIGRDVTDQRRTQAELAAMRDEALAANKAKSRFLAAMSHEIRTPMNGILGMIGLMQDTSLTDEQASYAGAIDRSARTLLTIIDEILDLSKIEAGKLEVHPVPFNIEDCVQSVVELMAPKAIEKGLELVWRVDADLPGSVVADEIRVRQILLNLIGNAIKFTDTGGVCVRVGFRALDDATGALAQVRLEVEDTGIGIPAEQIPTLFADFQQAEEVVRRRRGGTGLGLAISRRLAQAMGGDIAVSSRHGQGSRFTATMAVAVAAGPEMRPAYRAQVADTRVLLALDSPLERQELAASLTALDARVSVISTGELPAEQDAKASAILIDAAAGPEKSRALLASARRSADGPVRGVVLIDPADRKSLGQFRAMGFDGYLIRPVRPRSLVAQLAQTRETSQPTLDAGPAAAPPANTATAGPLARRVLLVEDNDINALLARRVAERAGCEVVHAKCGADAVGYCEERIAAGLPLADLVLMDIHMPGMDGFETTAALRGRLTAAGAGRPPIVALTANAFAEDRKQCLDEGLDDFLAKPFDRPQLEALLEKWCGTVAASRHGELAEFAA
ncbi:MAG: ATP-binding protein [Hyphomicrobiaceae bacterium]